MPVSGEPQRRGREIAAVGIVVLGFALGGLALVVALEGSTGLPRAVAIHGALMVLAWGILLPAGGVMARYFKVTPRQNFPVEVENLFWWRWHRGLQYAGTLLATVGLGAILSETGGRFDTLHGWLGLLVVSVGWLQIASAFVRGSKGGPTGDRADPTDPATWRGDHYDMSRRRLRFERWHKPVGWAVIGLAAVTLLLGIDLVGAPPWLVMLAGLLQGGTLLMILDCRLRQRWVDTYESLWGRDPAHPGNAARPTSRRRSTPTLRR